MKKQSWLKVIGSGLLLGLAAGLCMLMMIGAQRYFLGLASPPELIGDRIAPFFEPHKFFELLFSYGGYNQLKQAGARGVLGGMLGMSMLGGTLYLIIVDRTRLRELRIDNLAATQLPLARPTTFLARRHLSLSGVIFAVAFTGALWLVSVIALWPTLDTHYGGLPPTHARLATLVGLAISYGSYAFALVLLHRLMLVPRPAAQGRKMGGALAPLSGRRTLLVGGLSVAAFGFSAYWLIRRKLFDLATFQYDGLQYLGPDVQPITPNNRFYTVTKNVIDPRVKKALWRLEVTGLVEHPQSLRFADLTALPAVTQETTLMCISYSVGGGLMSNARWRGVPMRSLIEMAQPKPDVVEVLLHGADGYTDTFAIEKALDETTLVVYEMNGEPLPDRHGYPVRVVVPGMFGEKNVKWITRIELVDYDAKGFYEQQGWGPDFRTHTHSRIDGPDLTHPLKAGAPVMLKGVAYGGDVQGIAKVEVSFDDAQTWHDARLEYPGSKLAWALWSYQWLPDQPGEYKLAVRATDGAGKPQITQDRYVIPEGSTGLHRITARVEA